MCPGLVEDLLDRQGFVKVQARWESFTFWIELVPVDSARTPGRVVDRAAEATDTGTVVSTSSTIFAANGRVSSSVDLFGTTDTYADGDGTADPPALSPAVLGTATIYDDAGRVTKTQRLDGLRVELVNTSLGLQSELAEGGSVVWESETLYDDHGRVRRSIGLHAPDQEGPATDYEYDDQGRQTAVIAPAVIDPTTGELVRHRSESVYDDQGRLQQTWDNIRVVVDEDLNVLSTDDTDKHVTTYEFDALGRTVLTTQSSADGTLAVSTQTRYDNLGHVVAESAPYDEALLDVTWSETEGAFVDGSLHIIPTKSYEYDDHGRLVAVVLPAVDDPANPGQQAHPRYEYAYDARGNQVLIRDPNSSETVFTYDDQGRQLTRTLPMGQAEENRYNDLGQLFLTASFEGVVTEYVYDQSTGSGGRLVESRFYDSLSDYEDPGIEAAEAVAYTYDEFGRVLTVLQDADGDLVGTTGDQRVVTTTYDDVGRVASVDSPEGTIHYEYDPVTGLRVRTYTGAADPDRDSASEDGKAVTDTRYEYDALGRLSRVTLVERNDQPLTQEEATDYVFDLSGNLDEVHSPNGVVADYVYDALNRLEDLTHYAPEDGGGDPDSFLDNAVLARFDYDLAADGRRTGVTETDQVGNTTRVDWFYDDLGRLTGEAYDSHADDSLDYLARYQMDLAGNRLEKATDNDPTAQQLADFLTDRSLTPDETVDYAYDAGDRLLVEKLDSGAEGTVDKTTTYAYGENADLTDPNNPVGGDGTQQTLKTIWQGENTDPGAGAVKLGETTYTFNRQGRLWIAEIDSDGNGDLESRSEYTYDNSGIRVSKTETEDTDGDGDLGDETPETTLYLVDHHNPTGYQQVLDEIDAATMAVIKSHILGLDVISQQSPSIASGVPLFFLYDGHGSTRALLDPTGQILSGQIYAYDAYGNAHGFDPAAALTSLLYSGEQTDSAGLQYLRARYYDPSTGRFNRLDPFAGNMQDPASLHKYLYVHGNPVNGSDPTGESLLNSCLSSMSFGMKISAMSAGVTMYAGHKAGKTVRGLYAGGLLGVSMAYAWTNRAVLTQASKEGAMGASVALVITALAELPGYGQLSESGKNKLLWDIGFTTLEGFTYSFASVALGNKYRVINDRTSMMMLDFGMGAIAAITNAMDVSRSHGNDRAGAELAADCLVSIGVQALSALASDKALTGWIREHYGMNPKLVRELIERARKIGDNIPAQFDVAWDFAKGLIKEFFEDQAKNPLLPEEP